LWTTSQPLFNFSFQILQTGLEKNVFGNHIVTLPKSDVRGPPPAFASGPLVEREANGANSLDNNFQPSSSLVKERYGIIPSDEPEIVEVDDTNKGFMPEQESNYMKSVSPLGVSSTFYKCFQATSLEITVHVLIVLSRLIFFSIININTDKPNKKQTTSIK
jgi:hypothetical protein